MDAGFGGWSVSVPDHLGDTAQVHLYDFCYNRFGKLAIFLEPSLPNAQDSGRQVLIVQIGFQTSGVNRVMM